MSFHHGHIPGRPAHPGPAGRPGPLSPVEFRARMTSALRGLEGTDVGELLEVLIRVAARSLR